MPCSKRSILGIVMASISGFGQSGPWADRTSFDIIGQAMSGVMHMTGEPDGPPQYVGEVTSVIPMLECRRRWRFVHRSSIATVLAKGSTLTLRKLTRTALPRLGEYSLLRAF